MKDQISLSYCLRAATFILIIGLFYGLFQLGRGIRLIRRGITSLILQPQAQQVRVRPLKLYKSNK